MLTANFKPERTAAAPRGFPATAWLSCLFLSSAIPLSKNDRTILMYNGSYEAISH